jgi:hypothetical protein
MGAEVFVVEGVVVRGAVLPTGEEDAHPLESQGGEGIVEARNWARELARGTSAYPG